MKRLLQALGLLGLVTVVGLAIAAALLFLGFPRRYDWALRLPSPDGRFELVVLRGDRAAFDDFFYQVYVLPRDLAPAGQPPGSFGAEPDGPWRRRRFLVYSGYATPLLRWTGPDSLAIDLNDLRNQYSSFEPLVRFDTGQVVSATLRLGHDDPADILPDGSNHGAAANASGR